MKEFRIVDDKNNIRGEFDGIVQACREAKKNGYKVHVMNLRTKEIKEILSDNVIDYMASR